MAGAGFGSKFGSLQERQRLAQLYAAMTDGELRELARETESLTDEARTALAAEMERREISVEEPGDAEESSEAILPEPEYRDLRPSANTACAPSAAGQKRARIGGHRMLPRRR